MSIFWNPKGLYRDSFTFFVLTFGDRSLLGCNAVSLAPDVSKMRSAFIYRATQYKKNVFFFSFLDCLELKIEALQHFETAKTICPTTECHVPEDLSKTFIFNNPALRKSDLVMWHFSGRN